MICSLLFFFGFNFCCSHILSFSRCALRCCIPRGMSHNNQKNIINSYTIRIIHKKYFLHFYCVLPVGLSNSRGMNRLSLSLVYLIQTINHEADEYIFFVRLFRAQFISYCCSMIVELHTTLTRCLEFEESTLNLQQIEKKQNFAYRFHFHHN